MHPNMNYIMNSDKLLNVGVLYGLKLNCIKSYQNLNFRLVCYIMYYKKYQKYKAKYLNFKLSAHDKHYDQSAQHERHMQHKRHKQYEQYDQHKQTAGNNDLDVVRCVNSQEVFFILWIEKEKYNNKVPYNLTPIVYDITKFEGKYYVKQEKLVGIPLIQYLLLHIIPDIIMEFLNGQKITKNEESTNIIDYADQAKEIYDKLQKMELTSEQYDMIAKRINDILKPLIEQTIEQIYRIDLLLYKIGLIQTERRYYNWSINVDQNTKENNQKKSPKIIVTLTNMANLEDISIDAATGKNDKFGSIQRNFCKYDTRLESTGYTFLKKSFDFVIGGVSYVIPVNKNLSKVLTKIRDIYTDIDAGIYRQKDNKKICDSNNSKIKYIKQMVDNEVYDNKTKLDDTLIARETDFSIKKLIEYADESSGKYNVSRKGMKEYVEQKKLLPLFKDQYIDSNEKIIFKNIKCG